MVLERPDPSRLLVTIAEACQLVRVSRSTMAVWLRHGKVEAVKTAGGGVRIFADSLFRSARG